MNSSIARIYSPHYGIDLGSLDGSPTEFVLLSNEKRLAAETIERIVYEATGIKIIVMGEVVWMT